MKCLKCNKEFYNPFVKSNYCSKKCEWDKIENPFKDLFPSL